MPATSKGVATPRSPSTSGTQRPWQNDSHHGDIAKRLSKDAGTTYADEAGITLKDTPMPLFELLVLCMLASKPIDAGIAVGAAREVFHVGLRTPEAVRDADRADHDRGVRPRGVHPLRREFGDPVDGDGADRSTTSTATTCAPPRPA